MWTIILQMYQFFDIHTHNSVQSSDVVSVVSICAPDKIHSFDSLYSYGVHPYDAHLANDSWLDIDFADNKLMAIGEIGLDFRYQETVKQQIYWFDKQLNLASDFDLPVVIHCVKAIPQTLDLIVKHKVTRFVFHGFNSSMQSFSRIADYGGYVSFGALLLDNKPLQTVFCNIDLSMVLLESDQSNVSIKDIYAKASQLRGQDVGGIIEENFKTLFRYEQG